MIPWEFIATLVLGIGKFVFERIAAKKLSDEEFVAHIRAHQERRSGAGRAADDFEDNLQDAIDEANKPEEPPVQ